MKSLSVFVFSTLISLSAVAETISCQALEPGPLKGAVLQRHDHGYEPQWFEAILTPKGFFRKKQKMTLTPLYFAGDRMVLLEFEGSPSRSLFYMEMPGASQWHLHSQNVKVVLNKGTSQEQEQTLRCRSNRPLAVVNYCEKSRFGTAEETLRFASRAGQANLVDMVLSCGIEVNAPDNKGCTALMLAVDKNCGTGRFDDYSSLYVSPRILEALIAGGAFVDLADPVTQATPLLKSSWGGDIFAMKSLLDMEADVNAQDNEGFTPLMRAVSRGHTKAVELILKYRPQLELTNHLGQTAESLAHAKGYHQLALLLREPAQTLSFQGQDAGGCELKNSSLVTNQLTAVELTATAKKMFLLKIPDLGIELMVNPGEHLSTRIMPGKPGRYHFECGIHGGAHNTHGFVTVHPHH